MRILAGVLLCLLPRAAGADLVDRTVETDTPFEHHAVLVHSALRAQNLHYFTDNWECFIFEKPMPAAPGQWMVEVMARHRAAPHAGELALGLNLVATLQDVVPGHAAASAAARQEHYSAAHHFDQLVAEYSPIDAQRSRLSLRLTHPGPARGPAARDVPPGIAVVLVAAAAAAYRRVRLRRAAAPPAVG
jgi:hypothetical protein